MDVVEYLNNKDSESDVPQVEGMWYNLLLLKVHVIMNGDSSMFHLITLSMVVHCKQDRATTTLLYN